MTAEQQQGERVVDGGGRLGVFALASAVSGAATGPGMLVAGRFAQGVGEALAAPASLGLIALLFSDSKERAKALGIWGGLTGLGGVTGTVVSGVLTDLASWRWIFYINLPIALFVLLVTPRLVAESRMVRERRRLDVAGAVTATCGLVAIVSGLQQAASHPWGSGHVLLPLLGGVGLLAAMIVIETRSAAPLIPLRFFTNRTRVAANLLTLVNTTAFFTFVFLLTLFEQQALGYSPLKSGLSYVPFGIAIGAGIALGTALMPRVGVKPLLFAGFLGLSAGLLMAGTIDVDTSYLSGVLPCMAVVGVFTGLTFPAALNASLHEVTGQDSSLASAVQNTMQQVGGALGLAGMVTFAFQHATDQIGHGIRPDVAAAHGYALSFRIAAALLAVGAALVLVLLERVNAQPRDPATELSDDQC